MKQIPSITDVTSDLNNEGLSVNVEVNRQLAARYGITPATIDNALYDALGQRIVSTIFNQSDQYRVILVAKRDRLPDLQSLGNRSTCRRQTGSTGQVPLSAVADDQASRTIAARDQSSGAVSRGHRSRSTCAKDASLSTAVDEIHAGDRGGASAAVDHGHVPGRRPGLRGFAVERGVPADRGPRRRLHRAGRAVRELHPSRDDPVDPAVGRHRRAAGADDRRQATST